MIDDYLEVGGIKVKINSTTIMKKQYYGLSMGLINQANELANPTSESNYFVHIMKDIIQEFNKVGAECIFQKRNLNALGDFINTTAVEGYLVFSFRKEEYFSDILKTAELIVEDFARALVGIPETASERVKSAILVENFKMCFKPYCVEKVLPNSLPKKHVVEEVLSELKETINRGRGIPLATKPSIVDLLLNKNISVN